MNKVWLVIAAGGLMGFVSEVGAPTALAKERCVCSMEVPPVPPVAPVPPVPPVPPPPPPDGPRVHRQVMIIAPDGENGRHHVRRIVRVVERDEDRRMTRKEFMRRAERAFDEHDKNHDGVLDGDDLDDMADIDEDIEDIEIPDVSDVPEIADVPEPPEAPTPPAPPRHQHH